MTSTPTFSFLNHTSLKCSTKSYLKRLVLAFISLSRLLVTSVKTHTIIIILSSSSWFKTTPVLLHCRVAATKRTMESINGYCLFLFEGKDDSPILMIGQSRFIVLFYSHGPGNTKARAAAQ